MDHQSSGRAAHRATLRHERRHAQRLRAERRPGRRRGQSLVIFALSVTVLLGLAGLVIDVVRAFDLYAREQRAAEAGALAGVIYMPSFYNSPITKDNNSAISRGLLEIQKNGFGAGAVPPNSCSGVMTTSEVAICTSSVSNTALQVTITEHIDVFLLSTIGVQGFNVSATAAADFLQPYVLGTSPTPGNGNCWGDCSNTGQAKNYLASINGPGEFKESGDPFVYCEDGNSNGPPADGNLNDPLQTAPLQNLNVTDPSIAGFNTNHPAWLTGTKCGTGASGNPDQQPSGFTGAATGPGTAYPGHPGAYNFAIKANPGETLWIKNPGFAPHDAQSSCNGSQVWDDFFQDSQCVNYYTKFGPLTWDRTHFDDPRLYFTVTYSLYVVQDVFFRNTDTFATSVAYPPLDLKSADLSLHCNGLGSAAYDLTQVSSYTNLAGIPNGVIGSCIPSTSSNYYADQWEQVATFPTPAGAAAGAGPFLYRLAVEASPFHPNDNNPACTNVWRCGFGRHAYDIMVCANGTSPTGACSSNAQISGWNNIDYYLNFPSGNKNVYVPLAYVPANYAGRTINISLFDPGDSHGLGDNAYFAIVPPDSCINVVYPSANPTWVRTVTPYPGTLSPVPTGSCPVNITSIYAAARNGGQNPSDDIYNGLWITATMSLPSTFNGGSFWLDEFSTQGKNFDEMAVKFQLAGGSPVHLIG